MTVIAAARRVQVLIGGQDWSDTLISLEIGYSKRSQDGLIRVSGSLVLGQTIVPPESMNPRRNPSRFRRGQQVIVNLADVNGVYQRHPCGFLFILKSPKPPTDFKSTLQIELGCRLSLRDFFTADDDRSNIAVGASTQRTTVIQSLLTAANAGTLVDTVSLYPLTTPIPKQGGSYVQLAGKVAYGGLQYLWQDNAGNIRTRAIALSQATPIRQIAVGVDDSLYEPRDPSETPCEQVKCTGSAKNLINNWETQTTQFFDYSTGAIVGLPAASTILAAQGTDTIEQSVVTRRRTTRKDLIQALVDPSNPTGAGLVSDAEQITETYTYEGNSDGKLTAVEKRTWRTLGQVLSSLWQTLDTTARNSLGSPTLVMEAEYSVTTYQYDGKGIVSQIKTQTYTPVGAIAPEQAVSAFSAGVANMATLARSLVVSFEQTVSYLELKPRLWQRKTTTYKPLVDAISDYDFSPIPAGGRVFRAIAPVLVFDPNIPDLEISNAGSTNPPATERRSPQYSEEEIPIQGTATFTGYGTPDQSRERTISLDVGAVSKEQLAAIAQVEGSRLIGEQYGTHIQIAFSDAFFTNTQPLQTWSVVEPDGWTYLYQIDGLTFVHAKDRALVAGDGIYLGAIAPVSGTTPAPATNPATAPYVALATQSPDLLVVRPQTLITQFEYGQGWGGSYVFLPSGAVAPFVAAGGNGWGGSSLTGAPPDSRMGGDVIVFPVVGGGIRDTGGSGGGSNSPAAVGLVASWKFDNSLADASGNGYNLTANGSVTYTSGFVNQAIQFTGSGYLSLVNSAAFQLSNTAFSIACIFQFPFVADTGVLVGKMDDEPNTLFSNPEYALYATYDGGDEAWFVVWRAGTTSQFLQFTPNVPYLAIVSHNPSGNSVLRLRNLNTSVVTSQTIGGWSRAPGPDDLEIGGSSELMPNSSWIDAVSIWNRALTTDDFTILDANPQYPFE